MKRKKHRVRVYDVQRNVYGCVKNIQERIRPTAWWVNPGETSEKEEKRNYSTQQKDGNSESRAAA